MWILNGICFFVLIISFNTVACSRKVRAELNPSCDLDACKNNSVILVHVKAEGNNDTLHHLWDLTGKPSVLLALTPRNATLKIDWAQFNLGASGAVTFTPPPQYVYGVVVDKFIEFNDENDTGHLDMDNNNASYITTYSTENFDWKFVSLVNTSEDATLTVTANGYFDKLTHQQKMNGTVTFVMSAFGGSQHSEGLPHLLHSSNTSQIDVTLAGLSSAYASPRFGLHLVSASSDRRADNDTVNINHRQTLDDEHAPGVFKLVEMLTPAASSGGAGGFLQWRPVVYTSAARDMTSSTESREYDVQPVAHAVADLNTTLLYSALGSGLDDMLVVDTNVTFGVTDDGFYKKTKYAAWTVAMGYGHPPEEQFSMLVTLVLLIGLGLPAVVILVGTVCIVLRRLQRNNDDLFLSR